MNFRYLLRESVAGLFRNRMIGLAATGMMAACLLITGLFVLVLWNLHAVVDEAGAVNEIAVYIEETATEAETAAAHTALEAIENVASVAFISKAEGLAIMREKLGTLLDGLEEDNPIRDTFQLTVHDQAQIAETAAAAGAVSHVAKVNYQSDVAERVIQIRNIVAMAGLAFVVVLGLVSVFIVSNAIRMSAFARREEIRVMKTVGATNSMVRTPFVLEGLFISVIGGGLAYLLVWLTYEKLFVPLLAPLQFLTSVPIAFSAFGAQLAGIFALAACGMGLLGSLAALRRYLRV